MFEPVVSILSITYNHAPYIAEAIDSFLAQQTTFLFEIVIGDDCSTDGTRDKVVDYARRYPHIIRLVTSDTNVGIMNNFRRTFEACRGKYIAICEGDDYWHYQHKLQRQVDFLESHPDYGMVHTDYDTVFVHNSSIVKGWLASHGVSYQSESNVHVAMLLGEYSSATCTMCFSRALLSEVIRNDPLGFSGQFPLGDLQIKVGLASKKKVKYLTRSTATYRQLKESASHSRDDVRQLAWMQSCAALHSHLCEVYEVDQATTTRIRDKWVHACLAAAFKANDRLAARTAFSKLSLGASPTHLRSLIYLLATQFGPMRSALHWALKMRA